MERPGLATTVVDATAYEHAVGRFREQRIVMPTFAQLADPSTIPDWAVGDADPNAPDPRNLFRVHWHNGDDRRSRTDVPAHLVLPRSLTGVDATIVVALADRFPMIGSHKVLAVYACLAPRIVTGQYDPTTQRAVWPSTGNYCRGGVAISRLMGGRGVAVLPEGMSAERFEWLAEWVADPADVIRTPGTESNVKEIYDRCAELDREPDTVIFNQFSEFPNHLAHYLVTGKALETVLGAVNQDRRPAPPLRPFAFVAASGSAGTLGAGDWLKERLGTRTVAVEALECPTMLENGFGEHNIQGIGDKHIPLIHNVMATDYVVAVSDRVTDRLNVLFNTEVGRAELARRGVPDSILRALGSLGLSSICNIVAAIKLARHAGLGPDDAIVTVATDGAPLYRSELDRVLRRDFAAGFDAAAAAATFGEALAGASTDNVLELTDQDRRRIFNLGYYTWVEQQGVSVDEFEERRDQASWTAMRELLPRWDEMIGEFNSRVAGMPA